MNGGLKLNVAKTDYLACHTTDPTSVRIGKDVIEPTDQFKYLRFVPRTFGDIDYDVKSRISAAWAG